MNKQQGKELIDKVFTHSFERERYQDFLRNLLNEIEPGSRAGRRYVGQWIKAPFRALVNQYWCLGKYVDPDGEELDLLVVEVNPFTKLERARSALRNFAVSCLKEFGKDQSLIAFYAKDDGGADWRFSFVKIEYKSYKDKSGKIKPGKELTPARRYSYLVGKREKSHTAGRQLMPILLMDSVNPRLEEIEQAFSVETVTDEFFEQYKALFRNLSDHLQTHPWFQRADEIETEEQVSRFAKKLLGQIVFLYFLQKKGWLGAPESGKWKDGSKRFLRDLFDHAVESGVNYYSDVLCYLFYEALACERKGPVDSGYYERFDCRVPFLNGGLFEAGDYDWQNASLDIPDAFFHNQEKTKAGDTGTGILDVFDRYNFTIREDEPLDKEVAVDPEMLGKVFEKMLSDGERKGKGAFYTPREIVHYMCQESLVQYLDNRINAIPTGYEELGLSQISMFADSTPTGQIAMTIEHHGIRVPRKDIEKLIRKGYLFVQNDEVAMAALHRVEQGDQKTTKHTVELPNTVRIHARDIDAALADIKICDPAIGSGAFPVGMLHEIVAARQALAHHTGNTSSSYVLKRHAIAENLYGVDVDPSAIDIARLRLWLSLIVDEEDYGTIEPLPNLDYKIIQGDSLIGIDIDPLFNKKLLDAIEDKKKAFFDTTDHGIKERLGKEIDTLIHEITNGKKHFDFRVYFSEVWHLKDGFDVVIGNPPYFNIDIYGAGSPMQAYLKKNYSVYMDKSDILFYFFEKAVLISKGIVAFITSNAFLNAEKANKLRGYLINNNLVRRIINFENLMIFQEASITTAITLLYKSQQKARYLNLNASKYSDGELEKLMNIETNYIEASDWNADGFTLIDNHHKQIIDKIENGKSKLKQLYKIGSGMQTGCNDVFVFKKIPSGFPEYLLKKRMSGENINKYSFSENSEWILYVENVDLFEKLHESVRQYLLLNQDKLRKRADKKRRTTAKWWNFTFAMHKEYYGYDKIWCSYRANSNVFCFDDKGEHVGLTNTTVIFNTNNNILFKYLLALLNSEVLTFRYYFIGKKTGNNLLEYFENGVGRLPIALAERQVQEYISIFVDYVRFLSDKNKNNMMTYLIGVIDCLVYELYFPDELKAAGKELQPHIGNLAPLADDMPEEQKLAIIQREFNRLSDPSHLVRQRLDSLDEVNVVRTVRAALRR